MRYEDLHPGLAVVYRPGHPGATPEVGGVVALRPPNAALVRYSPGATAKHTQARDLEPLVEPAPQGVVFGGAPVVVDLPTGDPAFDRLLEELPRVVNALRDGAPARVVAGFLGLAPSMVLRVGHDARVLSDDDESEWQAHLRAQQQVAEAVGTDDDCTSVGRTGWGRCVEPAVATRRTEAGERRACAAHAEAQVWLDAVEER